MKTFKEFVELCEVRIVPDFDKSTLKPRDRTKPYYVLVHRKTNQILKQFAKTHTPGLSDIHYFKTLADAEKHRYTLAAKMNEYYPRRETAQLFTDNLRHPDRVEMNPEIEDSYPNVVDFT